MATHTPPSSVLKRKSIRDYSEDAHKDINQSDGVAGDQSRVDTGNEQPYRVSEKPPSNGLELLAVLYHFSMTVFYALLLYYSSVLMNGSGHIIDPKGKIPKYGGRFKFLTHINQWFQLGFFGLQFLTDLLPNWSFKCKLQKLCDLLFTTIAVPTAFFVAVTFWGIYAYDRSLVYPKAFDLVVPQYLNHFWHTTIVVWVLFETFLCFHRYPTATVAVVINFLANAGYLSWIVWVYAQTGFWVYPILKVLPLPFLVLFCGGCMIFSLALYFTGKAITHFRWGKTLYM